MRRFVRPSLYGILPTPMHDLAYFREHLELFEQMARNRNVTLDFEGFRALDRERRECITAVERLKAERNKASDEIARRKKAGQDAAALLAEMKRVAEDIASQDAHTAALDARLREFMLTVPNMPHSSVPVGRDASANVEVRRWGAPPKFDFTPKPHWELGEQLGILDLPAAVKMSGARFALYRGAGARLERALSNFFLDVNTREHGYTEILPPFIVNTESLVADGKLPKFAGDMFHLEGTDLWLTTTGETELTNLYRDETLDADRLPIKLCAWTACFRSEAGAAGRDMRGIKRHHQFQKVEIFKFTHPEKSYEELESLLRDAEDLLQRLGLHYRVILLCTGDTGFASSKTYDIEAWLPSANEFMEISSCSNCEAFQARRAGIRFKPKGGKSDFLHTLNGSGLPTGRTWLAILENFQQSDGSVLIPEVLQSFMGTDRIIPNS
ncbi:MAG TPA: serine--tRNA ligase [Candidatus Acidoferrales bacterium]|nr:serine--tRNA ligase [Candidatus Acidoferrales bacterium]